MDKNLANIAVLVSGGGTNLQALIDAEKKGKLKSGRLRLVISGNSIAYALKRAEAAGIPACSITKRDCGGARQMEAEMINKLSEYNIDLIILAGYMNILSADFIRNYDRRIINVHPSLIPSFCGEGYYGLRVHEAALKKGVKVTGATVHFVNEVTDGGEIIMQKPVFVHEGDTPKSLQERVMRMAEWRILPAAAESVCAELLKKRRKHDERV